MIRTRVAASVTAALLALAGLPSTPVAASSTVSCPKEIRPVDDQRAWVIADDHLSRLVGPRTLPFGATGSSEYVRTSRLAWTSGFFPASLWLLYERTRDQVWLNRARTYTDAVLPVARWRGSHDLGFMVGLPASLGQRLDPDDARRRDYASAKRRAAQSLSTRWNGKVGAIRSAYYAGQWGLIIDSAMNAPMLIEAGRRLGGAEGDLLVRRGHRHLLTLARTFVRSDGSTIHRQAFDPRTGRLLGPIYGQGLRTSSTWSRGQAWALNGFSRGYLLTHDPRLLAAARTTAEYWMANVPAGCVPAWDLDATGARSPRDSSAAAIAVDGLLSLAIVEQDADRAARYRDYALTTLGTLTSSPWVTGGGEGVLQRQAYNVPADRREGTYVWGDAYLLSSLAAAGR